MRGQRHPPAALYPRERPSTHCTGDWVGPRAGLDRCGKSLPPPGFDLRTVQPVASRYTDWATLLTIVKRDVANYSTLVLLLMNFAINWLYRRISQPLKYWLLQTWTVAWQTSLLGAYCLPQPRKVAWQTSWLRASRSLSTAWFSQPRQFPVTLCIQSSLCIAWILTSLANGITSLHSVIPHRPVM